MVVAGGPAGVSAPLPGGAVVIAADGGADRALELGLRVDLLVGDLDSVTEETLARVERSGARVERHPAEKDETDLELALAAALRLEPERILVVGTAGGRLDHLLGALLLLAGDAYAGVQMDAVVGGAAVHVVRRARTLRGAPGDLVSLLAVHGPAEGVVTDGLAYPLRGETLAPGSSRGVSNVFVADEAHVTVARGVLLAVRGT